MLLLHGVWLCKLLTKEHSIQPCLLDLQQKHNANSVVLTIINGIFDSPQAISYSILDLSQRVLIWSFNQQCDRTGIITFLNKGELLFALGEEKLSKQVTSGMVVHSVNPST